MIASRQALYVALSLAFRPPTPRHVEGGRDNELLGLAAEAAAVIGCEALKAPLARLGDHLAASAHGDATAAWLELEVAYNRLFVGPTPPLAHPYESVYRTAGGLIMGDCALQVLRAYAEAGFVLSPDYQDLPDHIAVELEYMAHLCQRQGESRRQGLELLAGLLRQTECAFLEGHLRCWLPQFCQRVLLAATAPYYDQWAQVADLFTQWDMQRMQGEKEVCR